MKTIFCLIALAAVGILFSGGCDQATAPKGKKLQSGSSGTVALEVHFGGEQNDRKIDVVCLPDSTVLKILERARNTDDLEFEVRGSGELAFVTSIGGVSNEGDSGKNWIFRVNDELGDASAGVIEVQPGDSILWSFGQPPEELLK